MRLEHRLEHNMNLSRPQRIGPSHFRRLPAKGTGTVDFPCFRCNPDVGGTLVALDQLHWETRGGGKELGIIGSAGAGANRPQLDPGFSLAPVLGRPYPAAIGRYAHEGIRCWHTEPAKLAPLKLHRRIPHHVL